MEVGADMRLTDLGIWSGLWGRRIKCSLVNNNVGMLGSAAVVIYTLLG